MQSWVWLIVGIVVGFVLGWLLQLWLTRRHRDECEDQLAEVTASLRAREAEIGDFKVRTGALEADLTALRAKVTVPEVELPEVELPKVDLPEVDLPKVDLPKVDLPKVDLPKVDLPDVDLTAAKDKLAGGLAGAGGAISGLFGKLAGHEELPEVPAGGALQVEGELKLPVPEVPDEGVSWSGVAAKVGEVAAELPDVEVSAPHVAAQLPEAAAGLPDAGVEALAGGVAVLDDLTAIKGIGSKTAQQLASAGLGSFAALAAAQPEQLRAVVNAPEWRQVDYGAWITQAQGLAAAPRARAALDDLTTLEGIGPTYAEKLRAAGITTFAELAAADEARLAAIIDAPAWRKVNYGEWIAQAKLAAAGDMTGLQNLQGELFARSSDNLQLIGGIGDKARSALLAAGIDSYAGLAAATPEQLAGITAAAGVRSGDFAAWIEEARLRAAGKRVQRIRKATPRKVASCPQDLSLVKGIGAAYEQRLHAAGIGTYWQVSQAGDAELKRILEIQDFQGVDLARIRAAALQLADDTGSVGRTWDGTQPDDFEPLEGIGEVYERRLYDAGICTYRALANATEERIAEICQAPEWRRPDYAAWIAQAKRLMGS